MAECSTGLYIRRACLEAGCQWHACCGHPSPAGLGSATTAAVCQYPRDPCRATHPPTHPSNHCFAGLDSATTATVCKYLGDLCRTMRCTTTISLLQPSGDVLALFDDVLLLAEG